MADTKILSLTAATSVGGTDEVPIVQSGTDKHLPFSAIGTYFKTLGFPIVYRLGADHGISLTAATEVTGLGPITLDPGTYVFTFYIIAQSATVSVSPMFGLNFTGTAAVKVFKLRAATTGTTAITGVVDDTGATSGQTEESVASRTYSTTAPNMGFTGGVATINVDLLYIIEGILIVTAAGDLELWHGSETATSTTVKAGTSVVLNRTA